MNIKKNVFSLSILTLFFPNFLQAAENSIERDADIKRNQVLCYSMDLLQTDNTTVRQSLAGLRLKEVSEKQKESRRNFFTKTLFPTQGGEFLVEASNNVFKITKRKFTLQSMGIPYGGVYEREEEQVYRTKYSGAITSIKFSPKGDCVVWDCISEGLGIQNRTVNITNIPYMPSEQPVSTAVTTQSDACSPIFSEDKNFLIVPTDCDLLFYNRNTRGYVLSQSLPICRKIRSVRFTHNDMLCIECASHSSSSTRYYAKLNENQQFELYSPEGTTKQQW